MYAYRKLLFAGLSIFLLLTACDGNSGETNLSPDPIPSANPERIFIANSGELGIFDPSVSRDTNSGRFWMSYSSVNQSIYYDPSIYWSVSIRLAFSEDGGKHWTDAGVEVAPNVEVTVGPLTEAHPNADIPAGSQGIWQSETSSLVYDPGAPVAERWKLIWHQYLNANLTSFFADYGWIAMRVAPTPTELANATTVKLFGGAGLQDDNSITGAPVYSPVGGLPAIQLNTDVTQSPNGADPAELAACIFAEPGLHATTEAVYLAVYCADASTVMSSGKVSEYLVYFRCLGPCNMIDAANWEYLGRLLTPSDAQSATGNQFYQAPAITEINQKTFLIVTPVDASADERYNGCRVYEFINVNSNQLRRTEGNLLEYARADGNSGTHHGACSAYNGLDGGILLGQFGTVGSPDTFQIYKSQVQLP